MNETKYLLAVFIFQCLSHCINELDNEVLSSWVNVFLKFFYYCELFCSIFVACVELVYSNLCCTPRLQQGFPSGFLSSFLKNPTIKTNTLSMRRPLHFKMKPPNWKPNATYWKVKAPSRKWFLKKIPKIANCH